MDTRNKGATTLGGYVHADGGDGGHEDPDEPEPPIKEEDDEENS